MFVVVVAVEAVVEDGEEEEVDGIRRIHSPLLVRRFRPKKQRQERAL